MIETPWLFIVLTIVIVLGIVHWLNEDHHLTVVTSVRNDDLEHITLLRQDIMISFAKVCEVFPFDKTDLEYRKIEDLLHDYTKAVDHLVFYWNQDHSLPCLVKLFDEINHIETFLGTMYDTLLQYCNVDSDVVRTFQDQTESVYEWFRDLRRRNQSQMRNFC